MNLDSRYSAIQSPKNLICTFAVSCTYLFHTHLYSNTHKENICDCVGDGAATLISGKMSGWNKRCRYGRQQIINLEMGR